VESSVGISFSSLILCTSRRSLSQAVWTVETQPTKGNNHPTTRIKHALVSTNPESLIRLMSLRRGKRRARPRSGRAKSLLPVVHLLSFLGPIRARRPHLCQGNGATQGEWATQGA